jgi:hypothetical protein
MTPTPHIYTDIIDLLPSIHSSNIGDSLQILHQRELTFAFSNVSLAGIITGVGDRGIEWFLMLAQTFPPADCEQDNDCVAHVTSSGGFGQFKGVSLDDGNMYFICAKSTTASESLTAHLETISICSNGVIIDDTNPKPGHVQIHNSNDYISDISDLSLKWSNFVDDAVSGSHGKASGIASYTYTIGKSMPSYVVYL